MAYGFVCWLCSPLRCDEGQDVLRTTEQSHTHTHIEQEQKELQEGCFHFHFHFPVPVNEGHDVGLSHVTSLTVKSPFADKKTWISQPRLHGKCSTAAGLQWRKRDVVNFIWTEQWSRAWSGACWESLYPNNTHYALFVPPFLEHERGNMSPTLIRKMTLNLSNQPPLISTNISILYFAVDLLMFSVMLLFSNLWISLAFQGAVRERNGYTRQK